MHSENPQTFFMVLFIAKHFVKTVISVQQKHNMELSPTLDFHPTSVLWTTFAQQAYVKSNINKSFITNLMIAAYTFSVADFTSYGELNYFFDRNYNLAITLICKN